VLYVALTRAVEAMIIIKKPKDSIFDDLGMEVMTTGTLRLKSTVNTPQIAQESKVVLRNYGTQESQSQDKEDEKDYEALFFGTVLHYALEMLHHFDSQSLDFAMTALSNRFGQTLENAQKEEIKKRIQMLLAYQPFQDLLKNAKQSKEQALSFEGELKQLDLLLEYENHCVVIEYKSSKKYGIKHKNQLRQYCKAIAKITGKESKGILLYLLSDGVEMQVF
jgi:exodeoxyribonuclease V beta subunit